MAKRKKKRGKQGWFSKAVNLGGWLIGLSRIIEIIINNTGSPMDIPKIIVRGATFGLSDGGFDLSQGLRFYTPVGGALGYRVFTSFLMRKFPIR